MLHLVLTPVLPTNLIMIPWFIDRKTMAQRSMWILPRTLRPFVSWLENIPMSDSKTPMLPITLSKTRIWSVSRRMCQTCTSGVGSTALEIPVKATEAKWLVLVDCRTRTPQLTGGAGTILAPSIHLRVSLWSWHISSDWCPPLASEESWASHFSIRCGLPHL